MLEIKFSGILKEKCKNCNSWNLFVCIDEELYSFLLKK
jgi:hypothetical protein